MQRSARDLGVVGRGLMCSFVVLSRSSIEIRDGIAGPSRLKNRGLAKQIVDWQSHDYTQIIYFFGSLRRATFDRRNTTMTTTHDPHDHGASLHPISTTFPERRRASSWPWVKDMGEGGQSSRQPAHHCAHRPRGRASRSITCPITAGKPVRLRELEVSVALSTRRRASAKLLRKAHGAALSR